jgi:hypothetical protein
MFLIKGDHIVLKEMFTTFLLSVDMTEEAFLFLFRNVTHTELFNLGLERFNTVTALIGDSIGVLTKKHHLIEWFSSVNFPATLPAIVFANFDETVVEEFFKQGTKLKYLKPAYGFASEGIHVVDSMKTAKQIVEDQHKKDAITQPGQTVRKFVLQDTLEDVPLLDGYKFHLRVWLVVVVRDKEISVYISNYHTYELAADKYDTNRLKEKSVWDTHKYRNSRDAFFPMERPDHWSIADVDTAMDKIKENFKIIFTEHHAFKPNYKIKNGFQIFGADVLLDNKQNPYILEINNRPDMYNTNYIFLTEFLHLGLGGIPMKLFSTLYGTPEGRLTPFTNSLQHFYKNTYSSSTLIQTAFKELFLISIYLNSAQGYLLYQKKVNKKQRVTRKNKKQ